MLNGPWSENFMEPTTRIMRVLVVVLCLLSSAAALARGEARLPLWELGIGAYGLSLPDYRGSDQRHAYFLPYPYVQYRGKRLRWDREGGRVRILGGREIRLDISLAASPPANSNDNRAREGMPDLKPVVEIGPELKLLLAHDRGQRHLWTLVVPLRMAIASNLRHTKSIGWVLAPYIGYSSRGDWDTSVSFGPIFATERYHAYFYQVEPAFGTPDRPAYEAKGGYSGARLTINAGRRFGQYWIGGFVRYDNLSGAAFSDSPLVRTQHSLMFGAGVARVFAASKEQVPARLPW